MRIRVTDVLMISSESHDLTDELSSVIHIVTDTKHKLSFLVEMSDGRAYESSAVVNGCDDYHESMWLDSPVNDINRFANDIQGTAFPDLVFYDDYDEYDEAESKNDESFVAFWLMYPNDRQEAEQRAIDNFIKEIIPAWSAEYFGNEGAINKYIQGMIKGYMHFY